jgi:hypothetical protein
MALDRRHRDRHLPVPDAARYQPFIDQPLHLRGWPEEQGLAERIAQRQPVRRPSRSFNVGHHDLILTALPLPRRTVSALPPRTSGPRQMSGAG